MITFKNIGVLREAAPKRVRTNINALKMLEKWGYTTDEILNPEIFRGAKHQEDVLYIKPTASKRQSANTTWQANYYTVILDNIVWGGNIPKRSQSIICSRSQAYASGYGTVYAVFPKKTALIGVCPQSDIWDSFNFPKERTRDYSIYNLNGFNKFFDALQYAVNSKISLNPTVAQLIKLGNSVDKYRPFIERYIKQFVDSKTDEKPTQDDAFEASKESREYYGSFYESMKFTQVGAGILRSYVQSGKPFIEFLKDLFNFEKNGFKLQTYDALDEHSDFNEVWTESDCILVKLDSLSILDSLS